ncbi:MAG: RNAse H family protein, partial [Lachnospiraceae bacterium]|nr:RNAse H family protein [Lachnospiraceae bacterium]
MSKKLIAYVDGSYNPDLQKYAFGCVFLTPEGEIVERNGSGSNPESAAIRNVSGEMLGAMYSARYA